MFRDKARIEQVSSVKIPKLKGHLKIVLRDVKTGKIDKVIEGDNIVTNAVKDIFGDNICGAMNYNSMLPLWSNWYRGILCYKNAHDEVNNALDPDDYFPKDSVTNPVTAHAGDIVPSDTTDDLTRGQPSAVQTLTNNSVTIGWEWGASQGNGQISALSLCHKDTGNAGLGSTSNAFKAFQPLLDVTDTTALSDQTPSLNGTIFFKYDDTTACYFAIGEDGDYYNGHTTFETTKITIYARKIAFNKVGLLHTVNPDLTYQKVATVTTSITFYTNPAYYFDYANKKLWLFTNKTSVSGNYGQGNYSTSVVNYTVLDISDLDNITEDSHGTITSDTSNLAPLCWGVDSNSSWGNTRREITNIIKQGNYVYLPTSSNPSFSFVPMMNWTGLKKINISDQSEQSSISMNEVLAQPACMGFDGGGIFVTSSRVINGDTGYTCANLLLTPGNEPSYASVFEGWAFQTPNKPVSYVSPVGSGREGFAMRRYVLANKMVNTTLYNLPSPVTKGNNQSMSITYTLTEV